MHQIAPPKAKQVPHLIEVHGDKRTDKYFWLNKREDPEVIDYLRRENEYLQAKMQPTTSLQDELFEEMKARIKEKDQSVPVKDGEFYYYTKFEEGSEYPIFCRRADRVDATEEILLDGNILAQGHAYFQFGQIEVSPDHRLIAYSIDTMGRRIYQIYIKDLQTGKTLPNLLSNVAGNMAWAADNQHLFYNKMDPETLRSYQIYRHHLNEKTDDVLVFQEDDETFDVWVALSKTKEFLYINSTSTTSSEIYFARANRPLDTFQSFHPREKKHEYDIMDAGDRFFILTNWDAKNFRIMEAPLAPTPKTSWREVIPHRDDTLIEDLEVFEKFLAIEERRTGLPQIQIFDRSKLTSYLLQYDDPTYIASIGEHAEYKTTFLRFEYESLTTPLSTYEIDMETQERKLLKQKEVLGGFEHTDYVSERLSAPTSDGTSVPISLVYRKDLSKEARPLLLYAYGSYGINSDPHFNTNLLSLLNRGFVFAIAHIRGGSEMGREWYEKGKMLHKMNTFTDFIAVAEFLIREGYTSSEKLYAMGGSAGGLLMGAVMNMRPDLFNGVVARVPFVDVVTTMLDDSLPLTTFEYDQWGNPADLRYYNYMKSYSPYDNVRAQVYPHLLVTTGLHDSQVQYWEPAKWVAKLRELKQGDQLVLLHTEMQAGHGGKSGRFQRLHETALIYAFLIGLETELIK